MHRKSLYEIHTDGRKPVGVKGLRSLGAQSEDVPSPRVSGPEDLVD